MLLKRSAADFGVTPEIVCDPPTGKSVAVVGSGPAGLTAAYKLARYGHRVVIFEQKAHYGGMMSLCIPAYRLPRAALMEDVTRVLNLGCELRLNSKVTDLEALGSEYDAVFLGLGTLMPKLLNIPGDDAAGVEHVIPFLESINLRGRRRIGKKVAVIGAGFSAMDAVRVSRRLGSEATIIYRRTRDEMPATLDEVIEAEEEGVELLNLVNPVAVVMNEGKVVGLKLQKQKLGEPDASGRPSPVPVPGSEFVFKCDMVIAAISQVPDLTNFPSLPSTKWGNVAVDEKFQVQDHPGVYSTGDCVTGPKSIIEGVHDAFVCVEYMNEYLGGKKATEEGKREE
jgi:NADPH-dependent glutamate synthase beta subunit-like oxidoreductase